MNTDSRNETGKKWEEKKSDIDYQYKRYNIIYSNFQKG